MRIESNPIGAEVWMDQQLLGVTPLDIKIPYRPFFSPPPDVRVRLQPLYREIRLDVGHKSRGYSRIWTSIRYPGIAFGLRAAPTTELLLVRRHGPIGTWESPID